MEWLRRERDQLAAVLDYVREGDTLVVTRLDRLARSTADLLGIVALLEGKRMVALHASGLGATAISMRAHWTCAVLQTRGRDSIVTRSFHRLTANTKYSAIQVHPYA